MDWKHIQTAEEMEACLDEEIQKNRIHNFKIKFLDPLGNPVSGIKAKAAHKNHEFTFGVCPNGHISMTNHLACGEGAEAETYWKRIGDLFNATTLWWGWKVLEPERGKHTFDSEYQGFGPMERMVERAKEQNHRLTAHAVLYPRQDVSPKWIEHAEEKEALLGLIAHVCETVERYRDDIQCWHPVNEAYDEIQKVGNLRVNEGLVYRLISDLAPNARIVDNGGYTIDPDFYEKGIRNAEKFGGRVDDLGIRGYFELYDSHALNFYKSIWEHFGNLKKRYGKGVRFTEIGAASAPRKGSYSPWDVDHTTAKQLGIANFEEYRDNQAITEETQAEFLVRMYKLAFAHPALSECTYWDLCDSYTWNQVDGGLIRADLSPKPAYDRLLELFHGIWTTQENLESNGEGISRFSGYDGEYEVKIQGKSYRVFLSKAQQEAVICLF